MSFPADWAAAAAAAVATAAPAGRGGAGAGAAAGARAGAGAAARAGVRAGAGAPAAARRRGAGDAALQAALALSRDTAARQSKHAEARHLRRAQDDEFEMSRILDLSKESAAAEQKRRLAEERAAASDEKNLALALEMSRKVSAADAARRRKEHSEAMAAALPPEPPPGAPCCRLRVKTRVKTLMRRFPANAPVRTLFCWVESMDQQLDRGRYVLRGPTGAQRGAGTPPSMVFRGAVRGAANLVQNERTLKEAGVNGVCLYLHECADAE